ncbi:MAG TPA: transglutaminase family protein [Microbacterium sp.]|nr:transglutaminase family protein [Microbacterium sp.]
MPRLVSAAIDLDIDESADLVFSVAVSRSVPVEDERLTFTQDGRRLVAGELVDSSGSRLHRLSAEQGLLEVRYTATVVGREPAAPADDLEALTCLRPSRYCESDVLFGRARQQFSGMESFDLLSAIADFAATNLAYAPDASQGTDSAVTTLETGRGVCRDYAHVVIALLRAMDVPARYASCYAPGLVPMDFHAVAEAYLDGDWHAVDATRLANRHTLVRIATGRDAADCAFLSQHGGSVTLRRLQVDAESTDAAPADDHVTSARMA